MVFTFQNLEVLLLKSKEKKDKTIDASNLGTTLVCTFIVSLKFLRDKPHCNSWWAQYFGMDLKTINESEGQDGHIPAYNQGLTVIVYLKQNNQKYSQA
ncbi:MAG: hypothetical protein EZS28_003010 [Streblomastix strix]|uniref:Uncharacterized protein n=1 Tax=Streblomastix strix TaxID=222440 RepID=A0A5J4X2H5_9EUKA|nr:MAG: hypothetical protein EZS28_003010 [Streblomastix strix]